MVIQTISKALSRVAQGTVDWVLAQLVQEHHDYMQGRRHAKRQDKIERRARQSVNSQNTRRVTS